MIHFLCITLVILRILSEPEAVVWAMAHKKPKVAKRSPEGDRFYVYTLSQWERAG
jgi:hypothetical protein